jgi:hypothetical protein
MTNKIANFLNFEARSGALGRKVFGPAPFFVRLQAVIAKAEPETVPLLD